MLSLWSLLQDTVAAYLPLLLSLSDLLAATTFPADQVEDICRGRNPEDPRPEMVAHLRRICHI